MLPKSRATLQKCATLFYAGMVQAHFIYLEIKYPAENPLYQRAITTDHYFLALAWPVKIITSQKAYDKAGEDSIKEYPEEESLE